MKPGSSSWRAWRRLQFALTPADRRISLKIKTDGRYLTYLLASLHQLGLAVRIFDSPWLYRELISLSRTAELPFTISTDSPAASGLLITDDLSSDMTFPVGQRILLDADIFNAAKQDLPKMPYFIHPHAQHQGRQALALSDGQRQVRVGFFGSHDPTFYETSFHFPMLSRSPILETLLVAFSQDIRRVQGPPRQWNAPRIALAIDTVGGDREDKQFLSPDDYFAGMQVCDFFLSPPGKCMPVSHNLIESMQSGAIPILNHPASLEPPLRHGLDCLAFTDLEGLKEQVRTALAMPQDQIQRMRSAVLAYVHEHLKPGVWWGRCLLQRPPVVLINNEEISVALRDNSASCNQA